MKKIMGLFLGFFIFALVFDVYAAENARVIVTVLTASNEGSDFNLDNDAFRDRLIQLFSYSSYDQKDQFSTKLNQGKRMAFELYGGYELGMTLQNLIGERAYVEVSIRKEGAQYVNTVLSVMPEGVAFVGGPSTDEGVLILVLERR